MSKEELLQYAKDEFKKIFGDKYDESRAISCVETQLKEKDSIEKAEEAVKAIISRTASKMEHFDFKPVITDGKKELVVDDSALVLDGKVVKKFDPKTTSLMDVVEMAQKILHTDKLKSTFKKFDDLKQALADAPAEIKENFNTLAKYFDEKSKLNVNFPKWMLKLGEDTYEVESDGSVKINGEKKDWKVSLTEPLQKILNIFAVKHNEARLNQNPSLTLHDAMEGLKEMLFDAPAEIKQDFNTLVEYFDSKDLVDSKEKFDAINKAGKYKLNIVTPKGNKFTKEVKIDKVDTSKGYKILVSEDSIYEWNGHMGGVESWPRD